MSTLSPHPRILAGFAGCLAFLLLNACTGPDFGKCDLDYCKTREFEVAFADSLWRDLDTLGSAGLSISFRERYPLAKTSAIALSCVSCEAFVVADSAVLTADRPIVSPGGETVPAGSNLLDQPWKDMLGRGDIYFSFRPGVRFESGTYAFAMTAPWEYEGTRRILSDTAYLAVP